METYKKIKSKKVVVASDHAGFNLKENIKIFLKKKNIVLLILVLIMIIELIILIMLINYVKKF